MIGVKLLKITSKKREEVMGGLVEIVVPKGDYIIN